MLIGQASFQGGKAANAGLEGGGGGGGAVDRQWAGLEFETLFIMP